MIIRNIEYQYLIAFSYRELVKSCVLKFTRPICNSGHVINVIDIVEDSIKVVKGSVSILSYQLIEKRRVKCKH